MPFMAIIVLVFVFVFVFVFVLYFMSYYKICLETMLVEEGSYERDFLRFDKDNMKKEETEKKEGTLSSR